MARMPRPLVAFGALVVLVSAVAFIFKLAEFSRTLLKGDIHGFAAVAIGTYLAGMVILLCVTLWAVVRGQFRDLEAPKHRMLALEERYDRLEDEHGRPVQVGDLEPAGEGRDG